MKQITKGVIVFILSFILGVASVKIMSKDLNERVKSKVENVNIENSKILPLNEERKEKDTNSSTTKNKCYEDIPNDVPIYPTAHCTKTGNDTSVHFGRRAFSIPKIPVNDIAAWYAENMRLNHWKVELDVSELGNSMVVYKKQDNFGNLRLIGIQVYNIKEQPNHYVILYPDNTVFPKMQGLKPVKFCIQQKPNKRCSGLAKSSR